MHDELIQGLKTGDPRAVGELYDRYAGALFGVVLRIVGDRELAENVLQDVFLKAWKSGASYDSERSGLFTWLNRIARNAAIDATRSAQFKQRRQTGDTDSLVYTPAESRFQPEHIGLREILGKLDEKYRVLIEKAYFEGYTQQELEEELGIPLGTVKTRMRHAMQLLRGYLSQWVWVAAAVNIWFN